MAGFDNLSLDITSIAKPLTEDSVFPFGQHKGKLFREIEPSFLLWLLGQDFLQSAWPAVHKYLTANKRRLEEAPKVQRVSTEDIPFIFEELLSFVASFEYQPCDPQYLEWLDSIPESIIPF